ncbi:alpha/beta fold hydrolase [Roseofilum casamattae]|uniref:Alpha/beta hydrolase n=1 Tax=Roseofilum casamattae BLCC-M143 TaxID=3022442 RepID=A0ABT7BTH3_9CYAN|nr:alpha/beta hydrolase [Roseofilum casamattae]MDJ1182484.1 alpha/beta hydrolase [Roseofilum casamattae BLCC-M143]
MVDYHYVECQDPHGTHKIAYVEWGDRHNENVLICVHGISSTGRDFDDLAMALQQEYRIICPDVVGRGKSDWLADSSDYGFPVYISDMLTLIQHLNLSEFDFLGTSMGGLIGMFIAAKYPQIIRRLVMNDIGPFLAVEGLKRTIRENSQHPTLNSWSEVQTYIRRRYGPTGRTTDAQWETLAKNQVQLNSDRTYKLHYDPDILGPLRGISPKQVKPLEFWESWSALTCPILGLHGQESDMLLPETVATMKSSDRDLTVLEIAGCGHPPSLTEVSQIEAIANWLRSSH